MFSRKRLLAMVGIAVGLAVLVDAMGRAQSPEVNKALVLAQMGLGFTIGAISAIRLTYIRTAEKTERESPTNTIGMEALAKYGSKQTNTRSSNNQSQKESNNG
jgi:hypothetical protein